MDVRWVFAGMIVQKLFGCGHGARRAAQRCGCIGQRDGMAAVLDYVREGDTLGVSRIDRLARSMAELLGIVALLEVKQVALRILAFGGNEVDRRSPTGRMLLTIFATVAEFERAIMLERGRGRGTRGSARRRLLATAPAEIMDDKRRALN